MLLGKLKQRLVSKYSNVKFFFPKAKSAADWEDAPYREVSRIKLSFDVSLENYGMAASVQFEPETLGCTSVTDLSVKDREEIAQAIRVLLDLPIYSNPISLDWDFPLPIFKIGRGFHIFLLQYIYPYTIFCYYKNG